jgi:hypothetical protein
MRTQMPNWTMSHKKLEMTMVQNTGGCTSVLEQQSDDLINMAGMWSISSSVPFLVFCMQSKFQGHIFHDGEIAMEIFLLQRCKFIAPVSEFEHSALCLGVQNHP